MSQQSMESFQRIPWDLARQTPERIIAGYTHFNENAEKGVSIKETDFQRKRMTAKGALIGNGGTRIEAVLAAEELVGDLFAADDGAHVKAVYDQVRGALSASDVYRGATVHLPLRVRRANIDMPNDPYTISKNALSVIYALRLADALQAEAAVRGENIHFAPGTGKRFIRQDIETELKRRNADLFGRFSRQPYYSAEQFAPGDKVLITDDHVESGAAVKNLADALERQGCEVVGVATFGALPESLIMPPAQNGREVLADIVRRNEVVTGARQGVEPVEKGLAMFGLSPDSLTRSELGMLDDILTAPDTQATPETFLFEMRVNQMVQDILRKQPEAEDRLAAQDTVKPFFMLSSGGPAVGKSAMIKLMEKKGFFPEKTIFIKHEMIEDCFTDDDFARHFHPEQLPENRPVYTEAVKRVVDYAIRHGYSVVKEDHMQGPEAIHGLVDVFKQAAYETYAVGLHIDVETHKRHREESATMDELTPKSVEMMRTFTQNWENIVSRFDSAVLFSRVQVPGVSWDGGDGTETRIVKTAEYGHDESGIPTCTILAGDHYEQFRRWHGIEINRDAARWDDIIAGETGRVRDFPGRVVRGGEGVGRGEGEAAPQGSQGPVSRFRALWSPARAPA